MIAVLLHIEAAAVAHRLANAQRDRHQVGDQRGPQAERNGHRHFFQDQVGDGGAAKEAVAEVQPRVALEHQPQAFRCGLVEAVLFFDVLDQFRVQATAGAGAAAETFAGGTADGTAADALQVGDGLFHRAAGAAWTITKLTSRMITSVGMISSRRRRYRQTSAGSGGFSARFSFVRWSAAWG
jgi:hypothetical protein